MASPGGPGAPDRSPVRRWVGSQAEGKDSGVRSEHLPPLETGGQGPHVGTPAPRASQHGQPQSPFPRLWARGLLVPWAGRCGGWARLSSLEDLWGVRLAWTLGGGCRQWPSNQPCPQGTLSLGHVWAPQQPYPAESASNPGAWFCHLTCCLLCEPSGEGPAQCPVSAAGLVLPVCPLWAPRSALMQAANMEAGAH